MGLRPDSGSSQQLDDFVDLGRRVHVVPFGARPFVRLLHHLGPPDCVVHTWPEGIEDILGLVVFRKVLFQFSHDPILVNKRPSAIREVKNEPILKAWVGERDADPGITCLVQGREQRRVFVGLFNIDYAPNMVIIETLSPTTHFMPPGLTHFDCPFNDSLGRLSLPDYHNLDRQQLQLPLQ